MASIKNPPHLSPVLLDPVLLNAIGDPESHYLSEKFSSLVKLIEIEVFSYCNRRCWFCPNSIYPRDGENNLMPLEVYKKIIDELSSIGYSGSITYSRYNEPLSKPDIFLERLAYARQALKDAFLYTHTNSDFLSQEYLFALKYAGLNLLKAQIYLKNEERYSEDRLDDIVSRISRQIKTKPELVSCKPNEFRIYTIPFEGMTIDLSAFNFALFGTDRGRTVPTRSIERVSPCFMPFRTMYIDYNGSVMPCCDVRSDIPEHGNYVMGSAVNHSLRQIFFGKKYQDFRIAMGTFSNKSSACATCTRDVVNFEPALEEHLTQYYKTSLGPSDFDSSPSNDTRQVSDRLNSIQNFLKKEGLFCSTVDESGKIQLTRLSGNIVQ